ncbi:hypothetical protein COCMIDRAFT_30835, partial [Bipolaris oryzae ATCC 44560]
LIDKWIVPWSGRGGQIAHRAAPTTITAAARNASANDDANVHKGKYEPSLSIHAVISSRKKQFHISFKAPKNTKNTKTAMPPFSNSLKARKELTVFAVYDGQ